MAKKKVVNESNTTKLEQEDQLASDVLSILNKKFKEYPNAIGFLSQANLVNSWCKTGSTMVDLAISNRPNCGAPRGLIIEISGLPGSSKSLMAAHMLAETQKEGGVSVLFDTEKAVGMLDFYEAVGIDPDKLMYTDTLRTLEEIYAGMEVIIEQSLSRDRNRPVTIVVDSVMGASTMAELEDDYQKDGWNTGKAVINSKAMRKIPSLIAGTNIMIVFINQLKDNLGATFGDQFQVSGGRAIPFTASVRLRLKVVGKLKGFINGVEAEIGNKVEVTVVKNRVGPPGRKVKFDIFYESGIDDYGSWLTALKDFGAIKQAGAWYSYEYIDEETGELITKKFQAKDFQKLLTDYPETRESFYKDICDKYIMKYKQGDFNIDNVIVDTEFNTEN